MAICPYCGGENADGEVFCEECGRPLKKPEKKKKETRKYFSTENGYFLYPSTSQVVIRTELEEYVMFPDYQSLKDGKWELIFSGSSGINLVEYLASHKSIQDYIGIMNMILIIFEYVQNKGYIIGSCDLEDFWLVNGELAGMVLRVVRPLLTENTIPKNFTVGEFSAPEVKNSNLEYIGKRTDVYLAAIIFNRIIIGNKYSIGNIDAQLFWGYTLTNASFSSEGKKIRRFHQWLGETLNMYPTNRKRNVKDARISFEKCCLIEKQEINSDMHIDDFLQTHVGKGKKDFMIQAGRAEEEWNEDSIEKWEKHLSSEVVRAYLLADGISNCDIGSGYYASNIIRANFINVLDEYVNDDFEDVTYDMVENLAHEIVIRSNKDIWKKACEYSSQNGSIMGSTFVFIFIIGGALYTYCLGDSPLYLIRKGNAIPLYCPDNAGYQAIKKGMSFTEYRQLEGKESIALYVGGEYSKVESEYYKEKDVDVIALQEGDLIIASSDGVLDYMRSNLSDTDWDKEIELVKWVSKKESLKQRASHIIRLDNQNGGGDNLSLILIEAGGKINE